MDCEAFEARLEEFLEGALPPAEAASARSHLDDCPACERLRSQAISVDRRLSRILRSPGPPALFAERLAARLPDRSFARASRTEWAFLSAAAAAAAAIAVAFLLTRGRGAVPVAKEPVPPARDSARKAGVPTGWAPPPASAQQPPPASLASPSPAVVRRTAVSVPLPRPLRASRASREPPLRQRLALGRAYIAGAGEPVFVPPAKGLVRIRPGGDPDCPVLIVEAFREPRKKG